MSDASIERFFETYAELYMASDVDAVAAMYEAPFLAVRESRTIHLGDREAVRQHLMGLMEAYRSAGRNARRSRTCESRSSIVRASSPRCAGTLLPKTGRFYATSRRATRCSDRSQMGGGSSRTPTTTTERRGGFHRKARQT